MLLSRLQLKTLQAVRQLPCSAITCQTPCIVLIGCTGGGDSILELPVQLEPVPKTHSHPQELKISGLMGGHSGLNISEDRGNAVVLAALVLQAVVKGHPDVRIISLTAGDKRNAIAREASAILEVRKWAQLSHLTDVGGCRQRCSVSC